MSTNSKFHGADIDVGEKLKRQNPSNKGIIIGLSIIAITVIIGVSIIGMSEKPTEKIIPIDVSIVPEKELLILNAPRDINNKIIYSPKQYSVDCSLFSCKEKVFTHDSGKDILIDWKIDVITPVLLDEIRLEICCDHVDTSIPEYSSSLTIPKTDKWFEVTGLSEFTQQVINGKHVFTLREKDWLIKDDGYYPMELFIPDKGQFNEYPTPNALQFKLNIMTKNPKTGIITTHYDTVIVFYYENEKYSAEEKELINKMLSEGKSVQDYDLALHYNQKEMQN